MSWISFILTMKSSENPAELGEAIYHRVAVSGTLPDNVEFILSSCLGKDDEDDPTSTFDIIIDGCLSDLIETTQLSPTFWGDESNTIDFSFGYKSEIL